MLVRLIILIISLTCIPAHAEMSLCDNAANNPAHPVMLQVLGSGGPQLSQSRASSSYLVWYQGQARFLIDAGSGSLVRLKQSGANLNDIEQLLISHFHVDHSNDLPALVKLSYFSQRSDDLPIFGPSGNDLMPGTVAFVQSLFGPAGAFAYLNNYLDGTDSYRLIPGDIPTNSQTETSIQTVVETDDYRILATSVHHGPIPALAWRIELGGKVLVFSGDTSGQGDALSNLATGADLLVAHNAVPENANGAALNLHMPPSRIGEIAQAADVKQLVLSHRMDRTLGSETQTLQSIRENYPGPVHFADDLECFLP